MVSFKSLALAATALLATATASPLELIKRAREADAVSPGTGTHDGFFYSFWTDGRGSVQFDLLPRGGYSSRWNNVNNWVGGKGWKPGPPKKIGYNGTWNNYQQNSYLSLYGWTTNPLVEYYIVEAYGTYNPSSQAQKRGSIESDGGTYDIYQTTRVNQPSILGTSTFPQFWSVRTQKRVGGNITTKNHFDAWQKTGLKLGSWDYMIMATEGYQSSGSSQIEIFEIPE